MNKKATALSGAEMMEKYRSEGIFHVIASKSVGG